MQRLDVEKFTFKLPQKVKRTQSLQQMGREFEHSVKISQRSAQAHLGYMPVKF